MALMWLKWFTFLIFPPVPAVPLPLFHSSQHFSNSLLFSGRPHSLQLSFMLTVLFFFSLLSVVPLLSPPFVPLLHWWGSDAGRDDSRTRFSLRVYYLCSGPFKTTQNGPGSQCGEFVLTSCLFLLLLLLLLSRSFLPSPPAPFGNQ